MADFISGVIGQIGRPTVSANQFDGLGKIGADVIDQNQQQGQDQEAQYIGAMLNATPEQRQMILNQGMDAGVFDEDDGDLASNFEQYAPQMVSFLQVNGYEKLLPESYRDNGRDKKPSSVLETEWYNNQTPEVQKAHMDLKRRAEQSPEARLAYQEQLNEIKLDLEKQKLLIQSNVSASTSSQDSSTKAEIAAGQKLGELRGDILADETNAYRNAKSQNLQLKQLENALDLATTGKYAQLKSFAGKYLPGVEVDNEQALQSIVTQYALSELQKQTGPKTDFDFIKAAETQVQAGNTKGANKIILERMKQNQEYAEARHKAFKKFKSKNKNYEDFEDSFSYESNSDGASITTQEQYDALPSGSTYIEDGQRYQKP